MRTWLTSAAVLTSCLVSFAAGQNEVVRWEPSLETAKRVAGQTNRLVLLHFWADWCPPCRTLDREVFSRADVAAAIESKFVPVKIHADQLPHTKMKYGVSKIPTDVIITPQGQVVARMATPARVDHFLDQLNQIAASYHQQSSGTYARMPAGRPTQPGGGVANRQPSASPPYAAAGPSVNGITSADRSDGAALQSSPTAPPYGSRATDNPGQQGIPAYRPYGMPPAPSADPATAPRGVNPGGSYAQDPPAHSAPTPPLGPAAEDMSQSAMAGQRHDVAGPQLSAQEPRLADQPSQDMADQLPPGSPPLALEGHCAVLLTEKEQWIPGDPRWGARHEGRTYLFAGPEQQQRFLASPDRYAPVLSGNDPVLAVDQNRMVAGSRQFGLWYPGPENGRVYLFSSDETLQRFHMGAARYLDALGRITGTPVDARQAGRVPSSPSSARRPYDGTPRSYR